MEARAKISLVDDQGQHFMGPGLLRLLEQVEARGSINQAAAMMNLSYPKALKMLHRLESCLGMPVLWRSRGGKGGGGATLTPMARRLMATYETLESRVQEHARRELQSLLPELCGATPSPSPTPGGHRVDASIPSTCPDPPGEAIGDDSDSSSIQGWKR